MISQNLRRLALGMALSLAVAAAGFAQYNGGNPGMGGTTSNGVYTPPKGGYKSSTGAAIGGAAAAGVVATYLVLRNHKSVVGCVEKSSDGTKLMNEKDKKTYALEAGNLGLKVGERVKLSGRKKKSDSGEPAFAAKKLVKDYGSCNAQASIASPVTP